MAEVVAVGIAEFLTTAAEYGVIEYGTAYAIGGAIDAGIALAATYGTYAYIGYTLYEQQQAAKKARAAGSNTGAIQGRTDTFKASIVPARTVYGRLRVGGAVVFEASCGARNETLIQVIALASHEIAAVEQIYINDQPVEIDGTGYVTSAPFALGGLNTHQIPGDPDGVTVLGETPEPGSVIVSTNDGSVPPAFVVQGNIVTVESVPAAGYVISWQYSGTNQKCRILIHLGGEGQYCDPVLLGLLPTQWDASHIGNSVAYLVCIYDFDQSSFPYGIPKISAVVRGKKLYDPRTGVTAWSENPALMMRDWMLSPIGCRKTVECIDDAQIAAAANICDVEIDYSLTFKPNAVEPSGAPA